MPLAESDGADPSDMQLSFAGCGFLCIYHAGVCAAIKEYAPQLIQNRIKGSSAGAIAAAGLICNICMSRATSTILQIVTQARAGSLQALSPNFDILGLVRRGLEETMPWNAHILCSNRLFISATRARDYANVLLSEFATREELIQAILCSCFIPFYCGRTPPSYRGEQYIDGGFSDNQPGKLEPGTVTVSPFSGESDICPTDEDSASLFGFDFCGTNILFTTQNLFRMVVILFPPSPEVCSRICRQGFEDALRFLTKNHLVPCVKCLTVQSSAIPVPSTAQSYKQHSSGQTIRDIRRQRALTVPHNINNINSGWHECERCMQPLVDRFEPPRFSGVPLPSVVQKTLAEMEARNSASWLTWLRRWRLIRWWLRLIMPPVLLPFELMQFSLRKVRSWLKQSALAPSEAYLLRFQHLVDFILAQIENRRLIHSPGVFPSAIMPVGALNALHLTEVSSGGEKAAKDALAPMAPMRKLSMAQRKESMAPLDLAMPGRMAEELLEEEKQLADPSRVLQQFCERHDAVLAFHYRDDETNELKICQIFDANGRHPRQHCQSGTLAVPLEYREEEANTESTEHLERADDSGLSLEEEEGNPDEREALRLKKAAQKDACCSPVRHFSAQIASHPPYKATAASRRHTFSTRPARLSASTRTLATPRFVAPGSRLYASNSMNALKTGEGKAVGARRKISVQTIGQNDEQTDSEDEEGEKEEEMKQKQQLMKQRMQRKAASSSVARK